MISPSKAVATSTARDVLPEAVGPVMTSSLLFIASHVFPPEPAKLEKGTILIILCNHQPSRIIEIIFHDLKLTQPECRLIMLYIIEPVAETVISLFRHHNSVHPMHLTHQKPRQLSVGMHPLKLMLGKPLACQT